MADRRGALAAWTGLVLHHVNQLIGGEVQLGGALAQASANFFKNVDLSASACQFRY